VVEVDGTAALRLVGATRKGVRVAPVLPAWFSPARDLVRNVGCGALAPELKAEPRLSEGEDGGFVVAGEAVPVRARKGGRPVGEIRCEVLSAEVPADATARDALYARLCPGVTVLARDGGQVRVRTVSAPRIVGWGSGSVFDYFQRTHPVRLEYLVDNDASRWGQNRRGVRIESPSRLQSEAPGRVLVIIYSGAWMDILPVPTPTNCTLPQGHLLPGGNPPVRLFPAGSGMHEKTAIRGTFSFSSILGLVVRAEQPLSTS
jgi:hypothetical protein